MSEDCVTHGTLVDQLGLLCEEGWMLGVEVGVGAGCRLEGHGADGALVENFAV